MNKNKLRRILASEGLLRVKTADLRHIVNDLTKYQPEIFSTDKVAAAVLEGLKDALEATAYDALVEAADSTPEADRMSRRSGNWEGVYFPTRDPADQREMSGTFTYPGTFMAEGTALTSWREVARYMPRGSLDRLPRYEENLEEIVDDYNDDFQDIVRDHLYKELPDFDWEEKVMDEIRLEASDWEEYLSDKEWDFNGFNSDIYDWGLEVTSSGIEVTVRVRIDDYGVFVRGTVDR